MKPKFIDPKMTCEISQFKFKIQKTVCFKGRHFYRWPSNGPFSQPHEHHLTSQTAVSELVEYDNDKDNKLPLGKIIMEFANGF